jgi:hypothetical protein
VTSEEAKQILLLYRPDGADATDPEFAAALEQMRQEPALQQWFDRHREAQAKLREKFATLPVPENLKDAILAGRKIVRPAFWWQKPAWLAAAAAIAFLIALWLRPGPLERFGVYRTRMAKTALQGYGMEIVTNDLVQVREFLAKKGGPANYVVPQSLASMGVTGGGHIPWGNTAASMLCFDRGDKRMVFLFVIDHSAIKGEPGRRPQLTKISSLQTASWTEGSNTYILAGPDDPDFLGKYGVAR